MGTLDAYLTVRKHADTLLAHVGAWAVVDAIAGVDPRLTRDFALEAWGFLLESETLLNEWAGENNG